MYFSLWIKKIYSWWKNIFDIWYQTYLPICLQWIGEKLVFTPVIKLPEILFFMNGEIKIHPFINTLWIIPEDLIVQLPDREEERPPDIMQWRDGAKKSLYYRKHCNKATTERRKIWDKMETIITNNTRALNTFILFRFIHFVWRSIFFTFIFSLAPVTDL